MKSRPTPPRIALLVTLAASIGAAQSPLAFSVASVKQNTLEDRIVTVNVGPGGRFSARGYTLVLLIQRAYGVMDWNVTGGPPWIRTDRFDVTATADVPGNLTEAQLQPRLQRLLADRFQLVLHESSQEMPGHALVVARGGPKLTPSTSSAPHPDTFRFTNTGLEGQAIQMPDLARFVTGKLGLIGVDETGLTDLYDVRATWKVAPGAGLPGDDPREALRDAVFTALRDQLGLTFVAKKISVRTLVIDRAQRASATGN